MDPKLYEAFLSILGRERCLTDPADRIPYGIDASRFHAQPDAVLLPETTEEVAAILTLANQYRYPVTPRGAGSGITGGVVPACGGAVLSLDRMNRILEVDPDNFAAVVQPGVVTADLNRAARPYGLFFAPDPASAEFSSVGGNIAENAGGMRAVKYGVTKHSVLGLEVVTPTGEVVSTGSKCLKDVVGYGLTELFVGSEGTLGVICKAICKLVPLPAERNLVSAFFPDMATAAKTVLTILHADLQPSAVEFLDAHCLRALQDEFAFTLPEGAGAQLLVEIAGDAEDVARRAARVETICGSGGALTVAVARDEAAQAELWNARRSVHGALDKMNANWREEDISVPIGSVPAILDRLEDIRKRFDLQIANLGHFGDGNIHISYAGVGRVLSDEAAHEVSRSIYAATAGLQGRIGSEHGIGLAKAEDVGWNLSPTALALMTGIKRLFDPNNVLNPGKCFPGASCPERRHA